MATSVFIWPGITPGGSFSKQMIGPAADNTAAPPFSFLGDLTSGYASSAVGTLDLVTAGTSRLSVNSTRLLSTVPYYAPDGSASAPSIAFASATNLGWYRRTATEMTLSVGGSPVIGLDGDVTLVAADGFKWTSGSSIGTGSVDLALFRDAANTLALKNGTNAQTFRTYGYTSGSRLTYASAKTVTEAVTLSGATSATTNIIPAGATVVNVATTTTTAITGASGYQVGDGTTATRYGDITGTAVGTASGSADGTTDPRWWANTARAITLTAKTSNFTAGVVQVTVYYQSTTGA